jgi:hypothetical protein
MSYQILMGEPVPFVRTSICPYVRPYVRPPPSMLPYGFPHKDLIGHRPLWEPMPIIKTSFTRGIGVPMTITASCSLFFSGMSPLAVAWRGGNRGNRFTGPRAPGGPGKTKSCALKGGPGRPNHALQKAPGKWYMAVSRLYPGHTPGNVIRHK